MTQHIVGYGTYVPRHRLQWNSIAAALGEPLPAGQRAVAAYDEDAVTMGVEAARGALRSLPGGQLIGRVLLATASAPYGDRTCATVVHAALDLRPEAIALDMGGGARSGFGALLAAAESSEPALVVLADLTTGLPGGPDERSGGDAAAALVFAPPNSEVPSIAEIIATATVTEELLDRWRPPGSSTSTTWEERFVEHAYAEMAGPAIQRAIDDAGLKPADVDHMIVAGASPRACRQIARYDGISSKTRAAELARLIGNTSTAEPGVLLAHVLDQAGPSETILLVTLDGGVSAMVLRTSTSHRRPPDDESVLTQATGGRDVPYSRFLTWRGELQRDRPRRPDPAPPAAPPAYRTRRYKFGLVGSRCESCGSVELVPPVTCAFCLGHGPFRDAPMANVNGRVTTFAVDRLALTPDPPLLAAIVDFEGGGRLRCMLTDVDPDVVAVGMPVEMTFRRLSTASGIHNYFWKARPMIAAGAA